MFLLRNKFFKYVVVLFLVGIACFNVYYFFIHRGVGPIFYFDKYFNGEKDDVLELNIYKDLAEEYCHLNKIITKNNAIVFIGDSITKRFNLGEFFPDLPAVVNRGIFSDTTMGVLNRVGRNLNNIQIEKLFILIGYNDLRFRSNSEIITNFNKLLNIVTAEQIYLHSILPVDASRKKVNRRIRILNKKIEQICVETGVTYINLYDRFIDKDGGIASIYSRDGVHPNYFGYRLWAETVKRYLYNRDPLAL